MTRSRVLAVVVLVVVAGAAYTAWLIFQVRSDLTDAQSSAERLQTALEDDDRAAREEALDDFQHAAAGAAEHTDGAWWSAMTRVPVVGDDATGVRALSTSLDTVAQGGAAPLSDTVDLLGDLSADGRVDVDVLDQLTPPVQEARAAFAAAAADVQDLDSSGYAGPVKTRFDEYVDVVTDASRVLRSAEKATEVLPGMVGADGPRDYLLVFQNNAEIRATGGLPGSWALVHAEDGELSMVQQGTAADIPMRKTPVLPLSDGEIAVYDKLLGTYFQDAGFTPDFPRSAELMAARWEEVIPGPDLDGVLALDPVAMSYLLEGTGAVTVADAELTPDNVVEELLSRPYLELDPVQQNEVFRQAASSIFDAATGDLADPVAFVQGLGRAADEGRFLVASFDEGESQALAGTRVRGALSGDDGATPHVDVGLNDGTGSKMSYYLRYSAEVRAISCPSGQAQSLNATMSLSQSIPPDEAAQLPDSVTGGGLYEIKPGNQLVFVRIYGPYGGNIDTIRMDGKAIQVEPDDLDGRPVATLVVELSSADDVVINWSMDTAEGQTGDIEVGMTPSIVPGNNDAVAGSAC